MVSSLSSDVPKEIQEIINAKEEESPELQAFATERDVILLAFIGSYVARRYNPSASAMASMNIRDEFGIEKILTELEQKEPSFAEKEVYLLVNSTGGNLSSAYKTARAIRDSFKTIKVFIPHFALSGGTLLALIGDKIVMGMMSQLSPLDVQVFYDGQQVSVNSIFNAQDTLNEIFQTQKPEELPYPYRHQVEFLDPILMEEWGGIQEEGQYYLKEILQKSGYDKDVDRLVRTLMFEFPTHGFVIHYDHALKLGLKVTKYTEDMKAWNFMRLWLSKYITQQTDRHFIRYVLPKKHEIVNKIEKNS